MHQDPRDVENEALQKQLRDVLARLDAVLAQHAAVLAQNAELLAQVAKLNERVAELLPVAKRKTRKTKPTAPSEVSPPALAKPPTGPVGRRSQKPTGRSAVPQHLEPDEYALRPDACAHCASTDLHVVDVLIEEKLHVIKEHQRRRLGGA